MARLLRGRHNLHTSIPRSIENMIPRSIENMISWLQEVWADPLRTVLVFKSPEPFIKLHLKDIK